MVVVLLLSNSRRHQIITSSHVVIVKVVYVEIDPIVKERIPFHGNICSHWTMIGGRRVCSPRYLFRCAVMSRCFQQAARLVDMDVCSKKTCWPPRAFEKQFLFETTVFAIFQISSFTFVSCENVECFSCCVCWCFVACSSNAWADYGECTSRWNLMDVTFTWTYCWWKQSCTAWYV